MSLRASEPTETAARPDAGADGGWRRPDHRSVVAIALLMLLTALAGGIPTVAGVASGGADPTTVTVTTVLVVAAALLLLGVGAGLEHLRVRRTAFRVGPERVELHSGLFVRRQRGIARDRIRSVELTADPVLRVVGLVGVRVGTGQNAAGDPPMELRALRRADAEALRAELLARPATASAPEGSDTLIAALDPGWARYAPLSVLSVVLGLAAGGVVLEGAGIVGLQTDAIDGVVALFAALGWLLGALVAVAAVLVVGAVASLGAFVEAWWRYRLDREASGMLRVRRGLLTKRTTSLEQRRLRGVAIVEPVGVRSVGAGRVDAVATGLSTGDDQRSDPKGLLPAAPRAVVDEVVAAVLQEPVAPTTAVELAAHPRRARGRRLRIGAAAGVAPAVVLAVLGLLLTPVLLVLAAVAAVVGVATGLVLAELSWRALGHGLVGPYLVTRSGATSRRTVVLRRDSIIGVALRSSPGQARLGLVHVDVSTAAGDGRYTVADVDAEHGVALAATLAPDLVGPVRCG